MKNHIIALILLVWGSLSSMRFIDNPTTFLNKLYKLEKSKKCGFYPDISSKIRKQNKDKFNFVNCNTDTIYILQGIEAETGILYEAIWTKKGRIEYKIVNSKAEIGENYFLKRLYPMIQKWDLIAIKREEKSHGNLNDGMKIMGAKMILNGNKQTTIKCITFNEFFDPLKDK